MADGGTQRLTRILGYRRAIELIITGRVIDAREAEAVGLINEVVPPGTCVQRAIQLGETIAALPQPALLEHAVHAAVGDRGVKVLVLRGAGRAFCAGFDFADGFHHWDEGLTSDGKWDPGKDFVATTTPSLGGVPKFMSLWRSPSR